jgi:hypothetical protein
MMGYEVMLGKWFSRTAAGSFLGSVQHGNPSPPGTGFLDEHNGAKHKHPAEVDSAYTNHSSISPQQQLTQNTPG